MNRRQRTLMVGWLPLLLLGWSGCSQNPPDTKRSPGTKTVEPTMAPRPRTSPKAGPPTLIVLADKRCTSRRCRTARTIGKLKRMAPGLHVKRLDWSQPKAKTIFAREGLKVLPAYLFGADALRAPGLRRLARFLKPTPKGALRHLKVRSDHDPRAEICDNGADDTGNGKADCQDPTCKAAPICRPEMPKRLEVFVMSQCPYGVRALDSMSEVLAAFDRKIDFRVHYIATARGKGFRSLHGEAEVAENIRELCAAKHYPKRYKYMDYVWCRNRAIKDKDWKKCTGKKTGIDAAVIERCASGEEGKLLLRDDIALAQRLRVGSSPTWMANNRFLFHGIPPETIKVAFCKRNPGLSGCSKKLSTKAPVPDGVCH